MSAIAPSNQQRLVERFAARYFVEPEKLLSILKSTAFKVGKDSPEVTHDQMAALLIVADQHGLNPFTREIFAFEDSRRGIVPVVSVDGWARIVNEHPQFDGLDFLYSEESEPSGWIESRIYRKDRSRPTVVREHFVECKRNTVPWGSHPRRMLRHKAFIQGARLAFGFSGIYDEDEAERIIEGTATFEPRAPKTPVRMPQSKQLAPRHFSDAEIKARTLVDDDPPPDHAPEEPLEPATTAAPLSMIAQVRKKAGAGGINEKEWLSAVGVVEVGDMSVADVDVALRFISDPAGFVK